MEKLPRTTNILESWHSRWSLLAGTRHLSINKMIDEIHKEQKATEGKILRILKGDISLVCSKDLKELDQILYEKISTLDEWSNMDFIEGVSVNLSDIRKI